MIRNKVRRIMTTEVFAEEKPKKNTEVKPKKVTPTYVKVIDDTELQVADKAKLVFSVSQTSQDSPAHVDIRTHVNSENYVGPTQKGINFDIEYLDTVIEILQEMNKQCEGLV